MVTSDVAFWLYFAPKKSLILCSQGALYLSVLDKGLHKVDIGPQYTPRFAWQFWVHLALGGLVFNKKRQGYLHFVYSEALGRGQSQ
jgi:hypothetical protein